MPAASPGGLKTDAVTVIRVLEEVSRLDSKAGWDLMISQGSVGFSAWFPGQTSREIVAGHPEAIICGALSPPGASAARRRRISGYGPLAVRVRMQSCNLDGRVGIHAHVMTRYAFSSAGRFESVEKLMFGLETDWPFGM